MFLFFHPQNENLIYLLYCPDPVPFPAPFCFSHTGMPTICLYSQLSLNFIFQQKNITKSSFTIYIHGRNGTPKQSEQQFIWKKCIKNFCPIKINENTMWKNDKYVHQNSEFRKKRNMNSQIATNWTEMNWT